MNGPAENGAAENCAAENGAAENCAAENCAAENGAAENGAAVTGAFVVSIDLAAPPASVFAAYADPRLRRRWIGLPGDPATVFHELDFRVGGHEVARAVSTATGVPEAIEYWSWFADVVADQRIVLTYLATVADVRRWGSLVTVELSPAPVGTRLTHTEQYSYFSSVSADPDDDGVGEREVAHLRGGVRLQLNGLAKLVEGR